MLIPLGWLDSINDAKTVEIQ